MISTPVIGLAVVVIVYFLGIILAIKFCSPDEELQTSMEYDTPHLLQNQGVEVFVVSRSENYVSFNIPRPSLISHQHIRNWNEVGPGSAPAYEEPPSYDDCIRNGLV